jgi:acyl carrier protein
MTNASIDTVVRQFIVENFLYGAAGDSLSSDTSFLAEGLIDSTGILELVAFLETTFEIRMADLEIVPDNLDSIARIVTYVERKLAKDAGAGKMQPASTTTN